MPNEWRVTFAEQREVLWREHAAASRAISMDNPLLRAVGAVADAQARKLLDEMWTHIGTLVMWNIDEGATGHAVAELDRIRAEVYAATAKQP